MTPDLLAQWKQLLVGITAAIVTITPMPQQQNPNAANIGTDGTSRNWSGYAVTGNNFTSVTGTWTVPSVTSNNHAGTDATWVGIGGISSNDLIQAGTQNIISLSGQVAPTAFFEMLPDMSQQVPLAVSTGDSITVTINQQSTNQWQITIKDNTTGQSYQNSVTYQSSLSSAEWIEEAPSNGRSVMPLDNFGTLQFTNASTIQNGNEVILTQSGAHAINMLNNGGQVLATTSSVGSDGSSFSITRTSAAATAPIPSFDYNPRGWRRRGVGIGSYSYYPRTRVYVIPQSVNQSNAPTVVQPSKDQDQDDSQTHIVRRFRMRFGFQRSF